MCTKHNLILSVLRNFYEQCVENFVCTACAQMEKTIEFRIKSIVVMVSKTHMRLRIVVSLYMYKKNIDIKGFVDVCCSVLPHIMLYMIEYLNGVGCISLPI
ncbi:hypothetical protein ACF0H5_014443 [Mactra antiquata]